MLPEQFQLAILRRVSPVHFWLLMAATIAQITLIMLLPLYFLGLPMVAFVCAGLIILGAACNELALRANDWRMPVWCPTPHSAFSVDMCLSFTHSVMARHTRLKILCDIIPIPFVGTASIGDLLLFLPEWYFIFLVIWKVYLLCMSI